MEPHGTLHQRLCFRHKLCGEKSVTHPWEDVLVEARVGKRSPERVEGFVEARVAGRCVTKDFGEALQYLVCTHTIFSRCSPANGKDAEVGLLGTGGVSPGSRDTRNIREAGKQPVMLHAKGAFQDRERLARPRLRIGKLLLIAVNLRESIETLRQTDIVFSERFGLLDGNQKLLRSVCILALLQSSDTAVVLCPPPVFGIGRALEKHEVVADANDRADAAGLE